MPNDSCSAKAYRVLSGGDSSLGIVPFRGFGMGEPVDSIICELQQTAVPPSLALPATSSFCHLPVGALFPEKLVKCAVTR
jgi:hypothetical protein